MIDVLSGASFVANGDSTLMALLHPTCQAIYLNSSPEGQKAFPRMVLRHVRTAWKYTMPGNSNRTRKDTTVIEFIVHATDLPVLATIQTRLQALFDIKPFALRDSTGTAVPDTTAKLVCCIEEPGGDIESLPQPNTAQLSIHKLRLRFKCDITRQK